MRVRDAMRALKARLIESRQRSAALENLGTNVSGTTVPPEPGSGPQCWWGKYEKEWSTLIGALTTRAMRGKENGVPSGNWLRRALFYFDEAVSIVPRAMPPNGEFRSIAYTDMRAVTGIRRKTLPRKRSCWNAVCAGIFTCTREFARTPEELTPADGREQCAA